MALRFSDLHAMTLALPHLAPGEKFLYRALGIERPWWSTVLSRLGFFFWRYFLLVATDQRLVLIRHAGLLGGYGERAVESLGWREIDQAELGWGVLSKTLRVTAHGKRWERAIEVSRFALDGNFAAAEGLVATWERRHAAAPISPRPSRRADDGR
jgi:hypothetical protein